MGEHANDALNDALDDDDARTNFHLGIMDETEAYERGIIDELGGDTTFTKSDLRPYQLDTWGKLDASLIDRGEHSTIMALPTGSGKTLTALSWLYERFLKHGCNCLWLVHRVELLRQARDTLRRVCPEVRVTEWSADVKDDSGQVVLAMILSSRGLRNRFDVVVIDEAHHAAMSTYRAKIQELDTDFILGLTATPTRLDNKDLGFQSISAQYSVLDLVREGFLAKPVYVKVHTGQKHKMKIQAGDFSGRSLRQLDNLARNELIGKIWAEDHERWGKSLVFCCDVQHAEHLETILSSEAEKKGMSPGSVVSVHSRLPQSLRDLRVERFHSGRSSVMINVGVFTEGFDVPDIKSVFMARPTASEVMYLQMVGRGTRISKEKDGFFVVDFVDELGKYSLLANQWAVLHLGAPDEGDKLKEAAAKDKVRELLQRRGVDPRLIAQVEREFVTFAGLIEYQGQFDNKPIMLAMTKDLYTAWLKLRNMFKSSDLPAKDCIEGMYTWADVSSTGMEFTAWKSLGWATLFDKNGMRHKGHVRFLDFGQTKLDEESMIDEVKSAIDECTATNKRMESEAEKSMLMTVLNSEIHRYANIPEFVATLGFKNNVLRVKTNAVRHGIRGADRAAIKEIMCETAEAHLDVMGIQIVLQWPQ